MKTYFILNADANTIKIGKSIDPKRRLKQLQTSHHSDLKIVKIINKDVEVDLHKKFKSVRLKNEWYFYTEEIKSYIKSLSNGSYRKKIRKN